MPTEASTPGGWQLSCGHTVPMLEHDQPEDPPRWPRMCPVCQKPRNVSGQKP